MTGRHPPERLAIERHPREEVGPRIACDAAEIVLKHRDDLADLAMIAVVRAGGIRYLDVDPVADLVALGRHLPSVTVAGRTTAAFVGTMTRAAPVSGASPGGGIVLTDEAQ